MSGFNSNLIDFIDEYVRILGTEGDAIGWHCEIVQNFLQLMFLKLKFNLTLAIVQIQFDFFIKNRIFETKLFEHHS